MTCVQSLGWIASSCVFLSQKEVPGLKEMGVLHMTMGCVPPGNILLLSIWERIYPTGPETQRFELEIHLGQKIMEVK